jgi:shikimate dehydrogenase
MWGGNTDVHGFITALADEGFSLANKRICVAGTGGAGRAIVAAALLEGAAMVAVWDVDDQRSRALIEHFRQSSLPDRFVERCTTGDERRAALSRCHLFVNASPVGMKPDDPSPVDVSLLPEGCMVFDAVYNIAETTLLRESRQRGLKALGGLTMLAHQGAQSFEIWFGVRPDVELMTARLRESLGL